MAGKVYPEVLVGPFYYGLVPYPVLDGAFLVIGLAGPALAPQIFHLDFVDFGAEVRNGFAPLLALP